MTILDFIRRWWPSGIVVAVIIYATLFPDPTGPVTLPLFPGFDKLIHAIMFGGLAGALAFDYERSEPGHRLGLRKMALFCLASVAAGGVIEVLQGLMGLGRGADWLDFGADAVGALVAYFTAPPAIAAVLRRRA